jgi:hypothetical protein
MNFRGAPSIATKEKDDANAQRSYLFGFPNHAIAMVGAWRQK